MSELKIAVCDDDQKQVDLLVKFIQEYKLEHEYNIVTSNDPANLMAILDEEKIDIAFLDIEMGDINGIDLGWEIRKRYKDCIIIFITGFRDYAVESYELEALNYMMKPLTIMKFKNVMSEAIKQFIEVREGKELNYFTLENKEGLVRLEYDQIFYFEKVQRKVRVHTEKNHYEFYGTLKEIRKFLDMTSTFSQCHQGYIVNACKIIELRKHKILLDVIDLELPVSRRFREELVETFENVLFEG